MCDCYKNEFIVVVDNDQIDVRDPHSYFNFNRRPEVNFKSPGKRSFLNECIRQIYILNDTVMPSVPVQVEYNRHRIWRILNTLMRPPKVSQYQASLDRVKRQLFREPKQKPRKSKKVVRNLSQKTECLFYKFQRADLGNKKIRRNYLDEAKRQVCEQMRQNIKRKHKEIEDLNYQAGVLRVSNEIMNKVCRYQGNMARQHPERERSLEEQIKRDRNTEACRLSRRAKKLESVLLEQQHKERLEANQNVLEASVRSLLYMKTVMGLILGDGQSHEENLAM